mmetsp:Transcript_3105/g.4648  ORF Transcript_3105/g.4648 Transcript_3105/m.4648 type:complete len:448 (-) Transcript_3105:21-1364(-)
MPRFQHHRSYLMEYMKNRSKSPSIMPRMRSYQSRTLHKNVRGPFYGENVNLPSALRESLYFPSRSFPPNSPTRLSYITSQHDFLSSDRAVTCEGLNNIYNMVRLRNDPTKRASVDDILMRLTGTTGPLFRSIDKTADSKVFLKLDVANTDAWTVRRKQVETFLKTAVHPDDHPLVFSTPAQQLGFSDPWAKFVNGRLTRNILEIPSQDSIEFAIRCSDKLHATQIGSIKKRMHASVSTDTTASTTSTMSTHLTPAMIDLTEDSKPASSPTHKVQVVEQRSFHSASPISSIDGTSSASPTVISPDTTRMQKLEDKVAAHDAKLKDIHQTVTMLDEKIGKQYDESSFNFNKFATLLTNINDKIIASVAPTAPTEQKIVEDMMTEYAEYIAGEGTYDPIAERSKWNHIYKQDMAHRSHVESERIEYADDLRREAEQKGHNYDYYAIACEC